jgi:protein-disulfide isomerase/uncharacterized membrane protein
MERAVKSFIWVVAVLASVAGMHLSSGLTFKHVAIQLSAPVQGTLLDRACEATTTASCEKVIESRWGQFPPKDLVAKIPLPALPTSEWGLFYFTFVFCWLMLIGVVSPRKWGVHLVFAAITAAGLGASVFLAYEMYHNLENWCPLCAVVHGLSLLLLICALLLWPEREPPAAQITADAHPNSPPVPTPSDATQEGSAALFGAAPSVPVTPAAVPVPPKADWPHWRMLAATPFIALAAMLGEHYFVEAMTNRTKFENAALNASKYMAYWQQYDAVPVHPFMAWYSSPRVNLPIRPEDPVRGPENAAHTLVVWSDFECPMCGQFEKFLNEKLMPLAQVTGGMKVVFRNWPLNRACNPSAKQSLHKYACDAARAALAAQMLGGNEAFWKMHGLLFARQEKLKDAPYGDWAAEIGLKKSEFVAAMDSPEVKVRLQADIEEGVNVGQGQKLSEAQLKEARVGGTPAIYIDGKHLVNWRSQQVWDWILHGYGIKVVMPSTKAAGSQPAQ